MNKIEEFYKAAAQYCCYISQKEITADSVPTLMEMLMRLYISAMNLPDTEPETIETLSASEKERTAIRISKQMPRYYWEVFDPFVQEAPVCGDLAEDLAEIAADLAIGMKEFEAGRIGNAVFDWKYGCCYHWGSHAVDALRALHTIRFR